MKSSFIERDYEHHQQHTFRTNYVSGLKVKISNEEYPDSFRTKSVPERRLKKNISIGGGGEVT